MKQIALLRGINVGSHNRIGMPALRAHLGELGYGDVQTIVASGNIVLESTAKPAQLERDLNRAIADEFGIDTPVICRTATQVAKVVDANPFPQAGGKELHVVFLPDRCPAAAKRELEGLDLAPEEIRVAGREVYAHYPGGMHDSPLAKIVAKQLKTGTDRNWNTIVKLRDLASR